MKKIVKEKNIFFYSSLNIQDNFLIWNEIKFITQLGYSNIIIKFDNLDLLEHWIEDNNQKDMKSLDDTKINLIYRLHLSYNTRTSDLKNLRRILNKVSKIEDKYNVTIIKSIDEELSNIITPNHMEYYGVKIITLTNFRWKVLKRFHRHRVYFEIILDRLFSDKKYMANALPMIDPLEKSDKLLFTQIKPIVKTTEFPYLLSSLTDGKYASYGPITRWSDILW
ncbi:MAG TPA: hypothetical protein EYH44_02280 [Thermoprotei archaeon]|nr:hypothetical protein [Thermoprotei archaeon]